MRFIGSKANLLNNIEAVINENVQNTGGVFCDIFSGTSSVAQHFKPQYEIISNDALYFSYVIQKATIENNKTPDFNSLKQIGILDPISFLEDTKITTFNSIVYGTCTYKSYFAIFHISFCKSFPFLHIEQLRYLKQFPTTYIKCS